MKKVIKYLVYFFFPVLKNYHRFKKSQSNKVSFRQWLAFWCKKNKSCYWPVHENSEVTHPNNIYVGINSNAGTRPGCYIQGNGGIWIGNYVHFASNIGVISGNHGLYNHMMHDNKEVRIDDYCWIGMNAMIMPGVHLGPRTIVGAGSVVTKSFPEGYCVIGGNPAKLIKELDKEKFIQTKYKEEYYGFIPKEDFERFSKKYLSENKYLKNKK
ncbi:MAG: acyltransferase [bacterium]|nr:acyltransferase [bacterium]